MAATISEARFGILDEFPILEVYLLFLQLFITPIHVRCLPPHMYTYIWVRGGNQRTPVYTLLDPKLAVESIFLSSRSLKKKLDSRGSVGDGPQCLNITYPS